MPRNPGTQGTYPPYPGEPRHARQPSVARGPQAPLPQAPGRRAPQPPPARFEPAPGFQPHADFQRQQAPRRRPPGPPAPPAGDWRQPRRPPREQDWDPRQHFPQERDREQPRRPTEQRRGGTSPNATVLFSKGQLLVVSLGACALAYGAYEQPKVTATAVVAACIVFYTVTALLKLVITTAGKRHRPPRQVRTRPGDQTLPPYAVLLPVHKEANMLSHLVDRVDKLMYPRGKLCVLLLIEEDDHQTLAAARRLGIPFVSGPRGTTAGDHVRVLVIPPGGPKTKPNALNVAMDVVVRERCEFVTIYDAEDRPEPDQLLKAVGTFRGGLPELACLQAELVFWNDNTNWVTALYWVGYKIHFTRFLPGLARLGRCRSRTTACAPSTT